MVNFSSTILLSLAATALAAPAPYRHAKFHAARQAAPAPASGPKRGIAYDETKYANAFNTGAVTWAWNWKSKVGDWGFDGSIPNGIEYVPMLYDQASASAFVGNVEAAIKTGTKHVLGFNEIDQCGGGGTCIDTGLAATLYNQYMTPLKGKVKIGSPSVTSDQNPASGKGIPALVRWKQACGANCPVDFIQLHWYGAGGAAEKEANDLITFITEFALPQIRQAFPQPDGKDIPIWLTEFAPKVDVASITEAEHTAFIQKAIPKLDACPQIERYSYFMAKPGFLNNADTSLASAGKAYIS